jgi:hypothetical protein
MSVNIKGDEWANPSGEHDGEPLQTNWAPSWTSPMTLPGGPDRKLEWELAVQSTHLTCSFTGLGEAVTWDQPGNHHKKGAVDLLMPTNSVIPVLSWYASGVGRLFVSVRA